MPASGEPPLLDPPLDALLDPPLDALLDPPLDALLDPPLDPLVDPPPEPEPLEVEFPEAAPLDAASPEPPLELALPLEVSLGPQPPHASADAMTRADRPPRTRVLARQPDIALLVRIHGGRAVMRRSAHAMNASARHGPPHVQARAHNAPS